MKSETSKLLLGFGLGALVGTAIGYLLTEDNRKKVSKGVHTALEKVKEQAAEVKAYATEKAGQLKEKVGEKSEQLKEKIGEKPEDWKKEMRN
jgi:gas vesicle protein